MRPLFGSVVSRLALTVIVTVLTAAKTGLVEARTIYSQAIEPAPAHNLPAMTFAQRTCEARINEWDKWYVICHKECKDIAEGYAFSHSRKSQNSPSFQRELKACLDACDSKYKYYRDTICQ